MPCVLSQSQQEAVCDLTVENTWLCAEEKVQPLGQPPGLLQVGLPD